MLGIHVLGLRGMLVGISQDVVGDRRSKIQSEVGR